MRFTLIDRITELVPGERIVAVKVLTMSEEYLQDHFPLFPVMPGVLMLEALYQASAWLLRATDDFTHSMVQLSEARNVTFKDFVQPGEKLIVEARIQKRENHLAWVQAEGKVESRPAVKARLMLDSFQLADRELASSAVDAHIVKELRRNFLNLLGVAAHAV